MLQLTLQMPTIGLNHPLCHRFIKSSNTNLDRSSTTVALDGTHSTHRFMPNCMSIALDLLRRSVIATVVP